ncbi:ABC transporter ATP-binding protein [Caproiciproducens faecalis]|uniref:ATP-binding cassette domain-containing protein n=1 Tax=Caproiciproducens faecalis TaxID=2820301 RepID=A0ABS7DPE3_9FIRM|nr:ABC transporter ATP-binding protein [Caproiciproducens faecalis]MBW7572927.1 ATP-binding cassette domain-containing protein [Caproiciproducens faecalis]
MIEVKNLSKRYGPNVALNNISFSVEEGTVVGFLGPNGAGKSTTMNIITGYLSASSGSVTVGGYNTLDNPNEVKKLIGYMPEIPPLYPDMTVKEYLNFMYDLKKVTLPREKHLKEICALVKITDVYPRLINNLSKGYKQRVGFAQALLGNPPVLILDEPTVGLDPKQIIEIRNLIHNLGKKHTIILSSHILPEIQAVCERIIIVNKGNLVADGTPDSLSQNLSADHKLILRVEGNETEVKNALKAVKFVETVQSCGEKEPGVFEYEVEARDGRDVRRELFRAAASKNFPILSMTNAGLSLEDVFLRLTSAAYLQDTVSETITEGEEEE